jgi:hypothetical protein
MGKGLQVHFTFEDEGVFTTPWSATITYRRPALTEWPEWICAESRQRETGLPTRGQAGFLNGREREAPRARTSGMGHLRLNERLHRCPSIGPVLLHEPTFCTLRSS